MSAPCRRAGRMVALSLAIYRALLVLYPNRFRHAYAAEMARVFRDNCRAAAQRDGIAGLMRVWRVTLGDLVMTALAERMEQDMRIARSALYRATALISLLGIAVWILGLVGFELLAQLFGLSPLMSVARTFPARWSFFAIGVIGLFTWLSARRGALVWIPGAVALATLVTMIVGEWYWTWALPQMGVTQIRSVAVVVFTSSSGVNQQVDNYAFVAMNLGFPVLGLALLVAGWMIWSSPGLRGASRTLLTMGAISAIYYFFTYMGAPSLLRNMGRTPSMMGMLAGAFVFTVVWLGGWALLGRQLWRAGASPQAAVAATVGNEE